MGRRSRPIDERLAAEDMEGQAQGIVRVLLHPGPSASHTVPRQESWSTSASSWIRYSSRRSMLVTTGAQQPDLWRRPGGPEREPGPRARPGLDHDPGRVTIAAVGRPGDEAEIAAQWQAVEAKVRLGTAATISLAATDRVDRSTQEHPAGGCLGRAHTTTTTGIIPVEAGHRIPWVAGERLRSDGQVVPNSTAPHSRFPAAGQREGAIALGSVGEEPAGLPAHPPQGHA